MSNIPITPGSGAASVAAETVGGLSYQKIEMYGRGGASVLAINPDGSAQVSIVGTLATTITGSPSISGAVTIVGTPSVSGTVNVGNLPTTQNVSGSVVATQGTNPWIITGSVQGSFTPAANQSVSGTVEASVIGSVPVRVEASVAVAIIAGSIAASFTPPVNQSVSGTVGASVIGTVPVVQSGVQTTSIVSSIPSSVLVGASIFGQLPSGTAVLGSVAALQGTNPWIITGSVQGSFSPAANQSVSGTVGASVIGTIPVVQSGTLVTSIVSTVPSSVLFGASIFGQLPAGTAVLGSVAVLQGTNPWVNTHIGSIITVEKSSSIIAINAGSVIAIPGNASFIGYWDKTPSIVGTYAEDAAHATGASGLFVMQVRNDTMSSITSADGDYSPIGGGPIGETIVANSPITKWVQGTQNLSTNAGASVAVIGAQGASIFTYITGVQLANMGSASVLVTLSGATSSVIAYTIAPAGGGSNIIYRNPIKTNANGAFTASISGQASVYVSAQGFISKT